jgi:cobalamin biosynthesis protein CobD/CbiB
MSAAAIVSLVGAGLLVVVLAAYLVAIIVILKHVNFTLGTIIVGIRAIANQVEPVNPLVREINDDLTAARDALGSLLVRKTTTAGGGA